MNFITSWIAIVLIVGGARAAEAPRQTPLFVAGQGGYHTYRIPSLIATAKGTLLALCEARKNSGADHGDIDLLMRRSTDHGKTWSPMTVLADDAAHTMGNPCPVLDRATGTIVLPLCRDNKQVLVMRSADDGVTWSRPVDVSKDATLPSWNWVATGPGVGIQIKGGRLVIPCDNHDVKLKTQQSHVMVSDDAGATWKLGGIVGPKCDECQIVELTDGALLLNMRSYRGTNRRQVAVSKNGGLTFSDPKEDAALIEPVCQASFIRLPGPKGGLLFSNPASTKREKMTVRLSRDEGKSWPTAKLLHAGPAAYSCLAVLGDGSIGCLYERGDQRAYETITFARFERDWLEEPTKEASNAKQSIGLRAGSCGSQGGAGDQHATGARGTVAALAAWLD